ncbi:envelope stress response membrane protein PspC [Azospirillum agricola]|uniref:envelope stress response membrane protein PspC n=1 Tax=Azospirillum agricola TaxID=1720247 RepID=UPI000A0EFEDC|nr:envelope stress response membrane protein PspC [Azospirillum agricola]MBP2228299.1 phage shock protein C [Azospirillum agricola]SMH54657.1 phage shock protein C (PspC) family protein [Azospirillum lipoferum]
MDRPSPHHSPYESPNPHRLYRNKERGMLGGVCAGVADYFGVRPAVIRLAVFIGMFFFAFPLIVAYVIAVIALPVRPPQLYRNPEEEAFWRAVSTKPDRTLAGLTQRFRDFEKRITGAEAYVASKEFELNRAIRDLDR